MCLYVFKSVFKVVPRKKLAHEEETISFMEKNGGVSEDGRTFFFTENYVKFENPCPPKVFKKTVSEYANESDAG